MLRAFSVRCLNLVLDREPVEGLKQGSDVFTAASYPAVRKIRFQERRKRWRDQSGGVQRTDNGHLNPESDNGRAEGRMDLRNISYLVDITCSAR